MNMLSSVAVTAPRLAVLVDGENLSAAFAGPLITRSLAQGNPVIRRVYGDAAQVSGWDAAPGFKLVHAGRGKNAADMLLCIEAMALVQAGQVDGVVVASSDGDFSHLATHLREAGVLVIGMGEAKAPEHWRKSCTRFESLSVAQAVAPRPKADLALIDAATKVLAQAEGGRLSLTKLGQTLPGQLKASGHASWSKFLRAYPDIFKVSMETSGGAVVLQRRP